MQNLTVGKLIFSKTESYYGLELCLYKANRTGLVVDSITARGCDVILASLFWYRDVLNLETFLRKSGLKGKKRGEKPIIIAGGLQATVTPKLLAEMVDYVFIGDGDDYLGKILDDIERGEKPSSNFLYSKGMDSVPEPAECPLTAFLYEHHGLSDSREPRKKKEKIQKHIMRRCSRVFRLEIARGCKFKYPFCLMSGLKGYREVPTAEIIKKIKEIPQGSMSSVFAPERTSHSGWKEIQEAIVKQNIRDYGSDARLENIEKVDSDSVILGLEGVSYRLRKSIRKNFTDDFIIEKMKAFCESGRRLKFGAKISVYYIADLPGETEEDYREILDFFRRIESENWSRNLCLVPVLNPLSPKPFTSFKDVVIHPFRNYPEKWQKIMRGGTGERRWGFRIKEYKVWGCFERVIDTIVHRGEGNGYRIIGNLNDRLLKQVPEEWETQEKISREILKKCDSVGLTDEKLLYA